MSNSFNINPLDISITQIQFNLIKKCSENIITEKGEFADIVEVYKSKDPRLNLSELKILCKSDKISEENRILEAEFMYKNSENSQVIRLFNGNKEKLIEYLDKKDFFEKCKELSLK